MPDSALSSLLVSSPLEDGSLQISPCLENAAGQTAAGQKETLRLFGQVINEGEKNLLCPRRRPVTPANMSCRNVYMKSTGSLSMRRSLVRGAGLKKISQRCLLSFLGSGLSHCGRNSLSVCWIFHRAEVMSYSSPYPLFSDQAIGQRLSEIWTRWDSQEIMTDIPNLNLHLRAEDGVQLSLWWGGMGRWYLSPGHELHWKGKSKNQYQDFRGNGSNCSCHELTWAAGCHLEKFCLLKSSALIAGCAHLLLCGIYFSFLLSAVIVFRNELQHADI